jgi:hypothetical protein
MSMSTIREFFYQHNVKISQQLRNVTAHRMLTNAVILADLNRSHIS